MTGASGRRSGGRRTSRICAGSLFKSDAPAALGPHHGWASVVTGLAWRNRRSRSTWGRTADGAAPVARTGVVATLTLDEVARGSNDKCRREARGGAFNDETRFG